MLSYQETLEVVSNGVQKLSENATEAHKNVHKEEKKRDYMVIYYIPTTLDAINFDNTSQNENEKET